jgi:nucleoside-diphosphate-sugar epimerase
VLLTGARGFVGREVLRQLLASGHEVVAVSRHLRAQNVPPGVMQVAADITGDKWQRWCLLGECRCLHFGQASTVS